MGTREQYAEAAKKIMGNTFRARPARGDAQFRNYEADIRIILGHSIESTHAVLHSTRWPELFEALADDEFSAKDVRNMAIEASHKVRQFFERTCDDNYDCDIIETMEEVDWNGVHPKGRVAYQAIYALYVLARTWTLCRQEMLMGMPPDQAYDVVATAAGEAMRMTDQGIDPYEESISLLEHYANYALLNGVPRDRVKQIVADVAEGKTQPPSVGPSVIREEER